MTLRKPLNCFLVAAFVSGAAVCLLSCTKRAPSPTAIQFTPLAAGINYARFWVKDIPNEFNGHAFRIDLTKVGARLLPAGGPGRLRRVEEIARAFHPVVATNASFFDVDNTAMGLVVDEGRRLSKRRLKKWGALVIGSEGAQIVPGGDVDLKLQPSVVVQGQPRLVVDGKIGSLKPQSAARTVVCIESSSDKSEWSHSLLLLITSPTDASNLAAWLQRPAALGGAGCFQALNLDGGPSTQLYARVPPIEISVDGEPVPNALAFVVAGATIVKPPSPPSDAGNNVTTTLSADGPLSPSDKGRSTASGL